MENQRELAELRAMVAALEQRIAELEAAARKEKRKT
jgi:hypothetical protein